MKFKVERAVDSNLLSMYAVDNELLKVYVVENEVGKMIFKKEQEECNSSLDVIEEDIEEMIGEIYEEKNNEWAYFVDEHAFLYNGDFVWKSNLLSNIEKGDTLSWVMDSNENDEVYFKFCVGVVEETENTIIVDSVEVLDIADYGWVRCDEILFTLEDEEGGYLEGDYLEGEEREYLIEMLKEHKGQEMSILGEYSDDEWLKAESSCFFYNGTEIMGLSEITEKFYDEVCIDPLDVDDVVEYFKKDDVVEYFKKDDEEEYEVFEKMC